MSKRKCNSLAVADKLKLLSVYDSGKSRDELYTEFTVPKSSLYNRTVQPAGRMWPRTPTNAALFKRINFLKTMRFICRYWKTHNNFA